MDPYFQRKKETRPISILTNSTSGTREIEDDGNTELPQMQRKFSQHVRFSEEVILSPDQSRFSKASDTPSSIKSSSLSRQRGPYSKSIETVSQGSSESRANPNQLTQTVLRGNSETADSDIYSNDYFDIPVYPPTPELELELNSNDGSSDLEKQTYPDEISESASYGDDDDHTEVEYDGTSDKGLPANLSDRASAIGNKRNRKNSSTAIVNAIVSSTDNSSLPSLTFRFWILSTLFTTLGAAISQYYWFRSNSLSFSIPFVQLATYPMGNFMASILPTRYFTIFGWQWTLNPGPFNIKEHVLISVAASAGGVSAYATDFLAIQTLFYHQSIGVVGSLLLLCSTQLLGYGLAGAMRKFLVYPASMVWPINLLQVALFNTLHENTGLASGSKSKFFVIALILTFLWELVPTLFFPTLSSLAILCLFDNHNMVLTTLGSALGGGFGFLNISFDWNVMGAFGPLYSPWWATANWYFGIVLMAWFIGPIIYYGNFWNAQNYPPVGHGIYQKSGALYDQNAIITNNQFDPVKYETYGRLYISPYFAFCYAISFAALTALITHVYLYYGKEILDRFRDSRKDEPDIHTKLMEVYPEVPNLWYGFIGISMTIIAIILSQVYPVNLPWWGIPLAIFIACIMVLPIGIIQAISNTQIGLNVLTELICGYILPGRPIANVIFKTYGYMTVVQCLVMVRDLKLGHYMKIPPRAMFITQIYGTVIGAFVNYFVLNAVIDAKRSYLDGTELDPTGQWTGRAPAVFNSASIVWGLIGPARFFGPGSIYYSCLFGFAIGFFLPIPFYLLAKKFPNAGFDLINVPIIAAGAYIVPQVPTNVIISGLIASALSQFYAARYQVSWFRKYNYVLAAALDSGTAICGMFIFATVTGFPKKSFPIWWGNSNQDVEHCTPGS
ncbi:hypothetical protein G9A89_009778 [Geosiphon pyriformis]|nr:hypothetical protein G9A89_009778 [Geosiphon pyriformis]